MKLTTVLVTLALSVFTVNSLVIPAGSADLQTRDVDITKRSPEAAALAEADDDWTLSRRDETPEEADDDDDDDEVPDIDVPVPGDLELDDDSLEPLTPEEEALLKDILDLPEDAPGPSSLARRDGTIERRGIIDKLIKLLLKKISKTNFAKKVWNYLSKKLRSQITKYLKSKAKSAGKVTKKMKNWVKSKIRPAVKAILKSMIGGWAAGKVVEHVLPWVVDLIIKIIY